MNLEGREYADWRPSAKKDWGKLIAHNRLDCLAMEMLAKHFELP